MGLGMDGYYSFRQIRKACTVDNTDPACTRRRFTEGGRLMGSVVGGFGAGWAAGYGVCTIVFGFPTGGTSAIWCGVLAGGAGAFGGGLTLGSAFEIAGEYVYEQTYQTSPH